MPAVRDPRARARAPASLHADQEPNGERQTQAFKQLESFHEEIMDVPDENAPLYASRNFRPEKSLGLSRHGAEVFGYGPHADGNKANARQKLQWNGG